MASKVLDHKCPCCGAKLDYNPTLSKWKCKYCENEFTLDELKNHKNASSDESNAQVEEDVNYVLYNCSDCGAEIVADEQTAATFCVYCGNTAILKNKLSGKFSPSAIIPFKKEKEEAIAAFKLLSKGRPLMPKAFNDERNIEKIRGIYIPFWLYDIDVSGNVNASATKVKSWTSGDTHYTKTDYYKVYRTASMSYEKIPVDGSTRFDNDIMNTLEPFDYKDLVPYNHAYLSGFLAERYDLESDKIFNEAGARSLNSTKERMLSDMSGYSSKTVFENTLVAKQANVSYALLPVWMVNVKYKGKYYLFAMNGQTGEFIGDIPIDKGKALRMTFCLFFGIFIGFILISYIAYLMGYIG